MIIRTQCRVCGTPISPVISDDYDAISDPNLIIPMATCNPCYDLREERHGLERRIKFICQMRTLNRRSETPEAMSRARVALEKLCQQYANMIARWHHKDGMAWDDACLDQIMENPQRWGDVLSMLWKMFKATTHQT